MKLTKSTLNATKNIMIERRIKTLVNEGFNKDQISAKLIEEGFGDFIRKGVDFVKGKTGLGMTSTARKYFAEGRVIMSDYGEFLVREFPTEKEVKAMIRVYQERGANRARDTGQGSLMAFEKLPKNKQMNLRRPNLLYKQIKEFKKRMLKVANALSDDPNYRKDKTMKKALATLNDAMEVIDGKRQYLRELEKAFRQAEKTGETEAIELVTKMQRDEDRRVARAANLAFMKQQDDIAKADREMRRKARNQKQPEDIIRGKSTERFGLGTKGSGG